MGQGKIRVRITKGVLEADKGEGRYVPQLCVRVSHDEDEIDPVLPRRTYCTTACPHMNCPEIRGPKSKPQYVIECCEFEMFSDIPIEFDAEQKSIDCRRI